MYWDSTIRAYWKECPACGNSFHGRKNKVYCHEACKSKFNNDLAAERKLKVDRHLGSARNNIRILERVMDQADSDVHSIHMSELVRMGFDSTAPVTRLTMNGEAWKGIGDFIYMKHEDGEIEIMRKNWKDEHCNN